MITNVAAGTQPTDAVNKAQLDAAIAGSSTVVVGGSTNSLQSASSTATGTGAVALGDGQTANGRGAVAIGDPNVSTGVGAVTAGGVGLHEATGGIAASVALGGMMVVPDSNVSINFNLATYRGEQGFAGGVVARVAPKVYISGGVAGSSVSGSTGGRVGIAFGF